MCITSVHTSEMTECLLRKILDIGIRIVVAEFFQYLAECIFDIQVPLYVGLYLLKGLGYIHSDIGHGVLLKSHDHREEHPSHNIRGQHGGERGHAEEWGQSVQVVFIYMEAEELRDHVSNCPLGSENLCQVLNVGNCCLSNREYAIAQPGDANSIQFFDEESLSELFCQSWE